ncbi:MAG: efflux RND transporter periplasmic adaptor subunit [Candidatus Accumulibacter sp.]|uniref:efflux RND transporter periplasmic adaptor subunit n=1 Tax=Accumulibacter sp. TaxID=2053492 RepID=UPI00258B87CB|nr:efflux RND transporter periplasmic adaptor subunit [Accumulibacter sp.]MCM8623088.1 efflux RND transporter periplasmic adaptor subunit [Accumulibacter sp.]
MTRSKMLLLAVIAASLAGTGYWYQSIRQSTASTAARTASPVPVTVARATLGDIPILLEVVGRAEAYESVTLKARLDGQVLAADYSAGQHVRQGEVLVRLDPGDFESRWLLAQANLARSEAQLAKARADVQRYLALQGRGFVSEEKVNELRTGETAAAATVKADQAALELARRQLAYTSIRAPFAGVVGARLVFPGSAVKMNETVLAVVNRMRPLYVTFSIPEKHLPRVREAMARGDMPASVTIPGNREPRFAATVRFLDNTVDASTGTIQMKALLENRDEQLTPGQFLQVSLSLATLSNAVVVPTEAVQQGPDGNFLFVVRPDNTVEPRKIEVSASYRGLSAIGKGVASDDTVVTDGQLRLAPGSLVQVKPAQPAVSTTAQTAATPVPAAQPGGSAR